MSSIDYPNIYEFYEDFEKESELIGQGTFGAVYKLKSKRILNPELENHLVNNFSGQYYAVKMMEAATKNLFEQMQREFIILNQIPKHTNIVSLIKVMQSYINSLFLYQSYAWQKAKPIPVYTLVLVMQLAWSSLAQEIDKRKALNNHFSEEEILYIIRQCCEGFNFLIEKNNIFHRDIKPENILIMNKNSLQIKITDFGVSRCLLEERYSRTIQGTLVGTPVFLSPALWSEFEKGNFQLEKIGKIQHNVEKSDIYSLGVTFLQCALLLKNEVCGLNQSKVGQQKTEHLLLKVKSLKVQQMLRRMLEHDEKSRASYSELIQQLLNQQVVPQEIRQEARNVTPPTTRIIPRPQRSEQFCSKERQIDKNRKPIFETQTPSNLQNQLPRQGRKTPQFESKTKSEELIRDGNFCSSHKDQIVAYYSLSFNKFCCEICYSSMTQSQKNETVTLAQYQQRINTNNFNNEIQEQIKLNLSQFNDLNKEQLSFAVDKINELKAQALLNFTSVLEQTSEAVIQQFVSTQNVSVQQFQVSLDALTKQNQSVLNIFEKEPTFDVSIVPQILHEQFRILDNHRELQERFLRAEDPLQVSELLNGRFMLLLKKSQGEPEDLMEFQHLLQSRHWSIQDDAIRFKNENRRIAMKIQECREMKSEVRIVCHGGNNDLFYQTIEGDLMRYNYGSGQSKLIEALKEDILCFSELNSVVGFGTSSGRLMRILRDDTLQQVHQATNAVSAMKVSKNGFLFGTEQGDIFSVLEQEVEESLVEQVKSLHTTRIHSFQYFDQFKCIVSASDSQFLNLHYQNKTEEYDVGMFVDNITQSQQAGLMTYDIFQGRLVKIWNFFLEDQSITLREVYQVSIGNTTTSLDALIYQNILFTLSSTHLGGQDLSFDNESQLDFQMEHREQGQQLAKMSFNNNILTYSHNKRIYVWLIILQQQ